MYIHLLMDWRNSDFGLPPLPCACASVRRAARAVTQMYSRLMADCGIEITQLTLMQVMSRVGPLTQKRMGEILAVDSTTLSRSLRPLEAAAWISSTPGSDRRERLWTISPTGKRKLHAIEPVWLRAQSELKRTLGQDGWEAMMRTNDAVTGAALRS